MVASCPITIYGASTGRAPIHVRITQDLIITQKRN